MSKLSCESAFENAARAHALSRNGKGTRVLYIANLERWLDWCERHLVDPAKPKISHASAFRDELQTALAPLSVRLVIASLSSMYSAAIEQETPLASWNPFKKLPRPPADSYARTQIFTDSEAESIISAAEQDGDEIGIRDAAILRLMYETGLRRMSVARIERAEIFDQNGFMIISTVVKGGKRVEVEVPERSAQAVRKWLALHSSSFLFPDRDGRAAMQPVTINRIVTARAKIAGVVHAHPHRFRASLITRMLDAGFALHNVQAVAHHSDPKTTLRYDRGRRGVGATAALAKFRAEQKSTG